MVPSHKLLRACILLQPWLVQTLSGVSFPGALVRKPGHRAFGPTPIVSGFQR